MGYDVTTLPKKYEKSRQTHSTGLTIWEVPGAGLYRVLEINQGDFTVETLAPNGWINLIILGQQERVPDAAAALQLWLDIQTPTEPASKEEA